MLQLSSGESEEVRTNVAIYSHALLTSTEDTCHWKSKVGVDCSSLPGSLSQQSSNQGLPVLHPSWSAPLRVSSGCAVPPSPTAPVLCHGPALWSPPSQLDGDSPMHAPVQLTSPSSPSCRHLGVPFASSPVSVWSPWCRPGRSSRGYDIPHWTGKTSYIDKMGIKQFHLVCTFIVWCLG